MESESDEEEFFDAKEDISFTRLKSTITEGTECDPASKHETFPTLTTADANKDASEPDVILRKSHMTTLCAETYDVSNKTLCSSPRDAEKTNVTTATSDTKQCTTSDDTNISCGSTEVASNYSGSTEVASNYSDSINNNVNNNNKDNTNVTLNDPSAPLLKSLNIDGANEVVAITTTAPSPGTPTGPAPVAPPRRKKKTRPKELAVDAVNLLAPGDNSTSKGPSSDAKLSIQEMNQVLERGNSLDVVSVVSETKESAGGKSSSSSQPKPVNINKETSKNSVPFQLTDAEILETVQIKNLDTGETIPLSMAENKLPECINPLTLHLMRIAPETDDANLQSSADQGDEDGHLSDVSTASGGKSMQGKRKKLKKFLGKTVQKIKSVADEVSQQVRKGEESSSSEDEQEEDDDGYIKFKNHRARKDRLQFDRIKLLQDLSGEHIGAVWTMKFSLCGKLLATAGQDNIVRVWVLKEAASNFEEMRRKYSRPPGRTSPTGSMTSSNSTASADDELQLDLASSCDDENTEGPFRKQPFVSYHGHTSDVLDLSWSKNYFLLSSSMDKTVRLWHISRQECLCCFQHVDFVTAICFHPRDDRYFLSGSLDGKIRLWNIPEKKVALWNELDGYGTSLVTAANFCQNGKLAVVGTYDGRCIFYDTEKLKYHTQVTVRSSRGKNARGRKISGIEPMPGEDKVLITSNDSRIRLYDLKDHSLYCKYKGLQNESSQIRANFSHDGKLILCGSEDKYVYIWRTHHEVLNVRKDRNEYYESFSAHDAVVTATIFAPFPTSIIEKPPQDTTKEHSTNSNSTKPFEIIVAADWQGGVKLYINR